MKMRHTNLVKKSETNNDKLRLLLYDKQSPNKNLIISLPYYAIQFTCALERTALLEEILSNAEKGKTRHVKLVTVQGLKNQINSVC